MLVEDRKLNILNVCVVKRTFEGKHDSMFNDNPVTSKYSPSKKYAVLYNIDGYEHNPVVQCVIGKKDAEQFVSRLKEMHHVS